MAVALLPTTALADSTYSYKLHATVTEPVEGQKPSTEATSKNNKTIGSTAISATIVTGVKWFGELDANGCFKAGVAYTVTVTEQIAPERGSRFIFKSDASINGKKATVISLSGDARTITASYTFPILKSTAQIEQEAADKKAEQQAKQDAKDQQAHEAELKRRWSQAEADANCPLSDPLTLVINENTVDMEDIGDMLDSYYNGTLGTTVLAYAVGDYHTLDGRVITLKNLPKINKNYSYKFPFFQVTRVVYDLWFPVDSSVAGFPNAKELWLSPKCDIQGILDNIAREKVDEGSNRKSFYTYDCVLFIPDTLYPNGPTYNVKSVPGCRVMLYSGDDVYAAARAGASAARDWCTSHVYTAEIFTPDRLCCYGTCQTHELFYYSCSKCGKCEYNPKHVCRFVPNYISRPLSVNDPVISAHSFTAHIVSDEHFLGLNAQGDRVYLTSCAYCGQDRRQDALSVTYDYYKNVMGMDGDQSDWKNYIEGRKKSWSEGGTSYNEAMEATLTKDSLRGFVVASDKFVSAKTSDWAKQDVQIAANDNLVDRTLLGGDYTQNITHLQFLSIAVKMTERMLGKSITPAPAGTFAGAGNEYVRKASAAGITSGVGDGKFNPDAILTRQEMAAFLYRALMYVKANSDTEYTVYTSRLGGYTDAGQLADWAREPMAFMNALGLISGTSDTTLSPNAACTIEQALIAADHSLDAGGIGWYQYVKLGLSFRSMMDYGYGDRFWLTSSSGKLVNQYGRVSSVDPKNCYAIKDR